MIKIEFNINEEGRLVVSIDATEEGKELMKNLSETTIETKDLTLNQILTAATQARRKQHETTAAAAKSLGIDSRTLKRYIEKGEEK